jgi:hypothetical protein
MPQPTPHPQWYRTLRAFIRGAAVGGMAMGFACAKFERPGLGAAHLDILSTAINVALFASLGGFEVAFAVRRYGALLREQSLRTF